MSLQDLIVHLGGIVTRKVDAKLFDWMMAISASLDSGSNQLTSQVDPNAGVTASLDSLICPYLGVPEWHSPGSALRPLPAQGTIDTQNDAAWVNPFGNVGGTGQMDHLFKPPPGTNFATPFTFTVRAKMPAGVANNTINVIIFDFDLATPLVQQTFTLTQNVQSCSVSFTGLNPTKFYQVGFQVNNTAQQCNPLIGKCSLSFPLGGGTGTFAGHFMRYRLSAALAMHNQMAGANNQLFSWVNPYSDFVMQTNADTFAYEAYNSGNNGAAGSVTNLWIMAAGLNKPDGKAIALSTLDTEDIAVGLSTQQNQTLTLRAGMAISTGATPGTPSTWPAFGATLPRCVYVPQTSKFEFITRAARKRCTILCDSIAIGILAADPAQQCWIQGVRRQFPGDVVVEGYGAQTLFAWIGNGNAALSLAVARYLCRETPDIIIINLMYNDYATATYTAATYQTNLQSLCSNIQTISPSTEIWLVTTGVTTNEGGGANSLPNFRVAMGTTATNLGGGVGGPKIFFVDTFANSKGVGGTQLFHSAAELADAAHPNAKGHGMDAVGILQYMQSQGAF